MLPLQRAMMAQGWAVFQFLLGCYRRRPAAAKLADPAFQFLLGCYILSPIPRRRGVWEQLSIPFRMLQAVEESLLVAHIHPFQFLLGCYGHLTT